MKTATEVSVKQELLTPMVPNFIRTRDGKAVSVGELSPEALEKIAAQWLIDLKENALKIQVNRELANLP